MLIAFFALLTFRTFIRHVNWYARKGQSSQPIPRSRFVELDVKGKVNQIQHKAQETTLTNFTWKKTRGKATKNQLTRAPTEMYRHVTIHY